LRVLDTDRSSPGGFDPAKHKRVLAEWRAERSIGVAYRHFDIVRARNTKTPYIEVANGQIVPRAK
jgi:hypothetical protein